MPFYMTGVLSIAEFASCAVKVSDACTFSRHQAQLTHFSAEGVQGTGWPGCGKGSTAHEVHKQ